MSVVRLGELVGFVEKVEVRCTRCDRRGRLRLAKLIAEHGPEMSFPALGDRLAAGCPKATASYGERCFVVFADLVRFAAAQAADQPESP
jgi:hypothetical protein